MILKIFLTVLIIILIFIGVKLHLIKRKKTTLKKILTYFNLGQQDNRPQILVNGYNYTQYWKFENNDSLVVNSFDFRNINKIEISEFNSDFKVKLIPYNNNLIAQSSSYLTSQQDFELFFKSKEKAIEAKNIITSHIKKISTKKIKLNIKDIKSIKISFHKKNHKQIEISKEDISKFVSNLNSSKKSKESNVYFNTIILITMNNNTTRVFWRNNNYLFETYNSIYKVNDLTFLDSLLRNNEFGHVFEKDNENTYSIS